MTWPEALDSFEASITRVETGLRTGAWSPDVAFSPQGELGPASGEDLARLVHLQARSAQACDCLRVAMAQTAAELRLAGRRRQASRGYLRAQILAAAPAQRWGG
jgi:hypothetical protein